MLPVLSSPNCGEFRLLSEAVRGPVTVAWDAVHAMTGQRARLTMLCPPPLAEPAVVETMAAAFREAVERTRRCEGTVALPVERVHEANGLPYAVTFLPDGVLLDEWLEAQEERPIPLPLAMLVGSALGHAIGHVHEHGAAHGYLHAANVLLTGDHRPLLLDLGLHTAGAAAAEQAGFPLVAPGAVLPPGCRFGEDDRASDTHALGVLLLQILSGTRLESLTLTELAARLPMELPASLRESIDLALSDGRGAAHAAPRALAAHLA